MASKLVESAMREVHRNTPSTVKRAKSFGPGGKEAMLRAIAFSKARKSGAKVPKRGFAKLRESAKGA